MSGVRIEKTVPERWQDAHTELERLKMKSLVGADLIRIFNNQTANTWDITGTVGAFADAQWRVTFTPTVPPEAPYYTELGFDYQISVEETWDEERISSWDDPSTIANTGVKRFIIYFNNSGMSSKNISFKMAVKSTAEGSLSWTRIV